MIARNYCEPRSQKRDLGHAIYVSFFDCLNFYLIRPHLQRRGRASRIAAMNMNLLAVKFSSSPTNAKYGLAVFGPILGECDEDKWRIRRS